MGITRSDVPVHPGSVSLDPSGFSWCLPLRACPMLLSHKCWPFSSPSTCCSWITLLIFKTKSGGPSPCFPNLKWADSSLSGFLCFLGFSLFLWYLRLSHVLWYIYLQPGIYSWGQCIHIQNEAALTLKIYKWMLLYECDLERCIV